MSCTDRDGAYVDGHLPADIPVRCFDAWNHVSPPGSQRHWVVESPRSGLLQGAETYLRGAAARKGTAREIAAMLRTVIQEWDEQHSAVGAAQATG